MIEAYNIGDVVKMADDAVEYYGKGYEGDHFTVSGVSFSQAEHPGYDEQVGGPLYDLTHGMDDDDFEWSLYHYELVLVWQKGDAIENTTSPDDGGDCENLIRALIVANNRPHESSLTILQIEAVVKAYIECVGFAELPERYAKSGMFYWPRELRIHNSMVERAVNDCIAFMLAVEKHSPYLVGVLEIGVNREVAGKTMRMDLESLGHDFLYTRNGHGVGFWENEWDFDGDGWPGNMLDELSETAGEAYFTVEFDTLYQE